MNSSTLGKEESAEEVEVEVGKALRGVCEGDSGRNALRRHLARVNPRVHLPRRLEGHAACGVRIRP